MNKREQMPKFARHRRDDTGLHQTVDEDCHHFAKMCRLEGVVRHKTEGTLWGFCSRYQKAYEFYNHVLPMLSRCMKGGGDLARYQWNTYYLNFIAFKSVYNELLSGYYTTAGNVLRTILESFVRMRYFEIKKDDALILQFYRDYPAFCRKHGVWTIFSTVAKSWHRHYGLLCDISHGSLAATLVLKHPDIDVFPDSVYFNEQSFKFIVDKLIPILHAHLKAMGQLMLPTAATLLSRGNFDSALEHILPYTRGTRLMAMIEELVPGAIPENPSRPTIAPAVV